MHYFAEWLHELIDPRGPEFWILLSTIVFLILAWKAGLFRTIARGLDSRAEIIQQELQQARELREEAQRLLAEYKAKHAAAQVEAQQIVENAKAEAERRKDEELVKLQDYVARRTRMAEQKIARAEANAVAEVRSAATDAAVAAAGKLLGDEARDSKTVMNEALKEVSSRFN